MAYQLLVIDGSAGSDLQAAAFAAHLTTHLSRRGSAVTYQARPEAPREPMGTSRIADIYVLCLPAAGVTADLQDFLAALPPGHLAAAAFVILHRGNTEGLAAVLDTAACVSSCLIPPDPRGPLPAELTAALQTAARTVAGIQRRRESLRLAAIYADSPIAATAF